MNDHRSIKCARLARFVAAVTMALQGLAQQPKPVASMDSGLQISQYMREAGLSYLDLLDKAFDQAAQDHIAYMKAVGKRDGSYGFLDVPDGSSLDDTQCGKDLSRFEECIEINIQSEPDKKFLKFLRDTRAIAGTAYFNVLKTDPTYRDLRLMPTIGKLYPICVAQAHGIIRSGTFSYGACANSDYNAALRLDDPKAAAEIERLKENAKKKQ